MGRHTAPQGEAVHPVVAAALARRPADAPTGRHGRLRADAGSGLGWPGESTTHEGLGWPGGMPDRDRAAVQDTGPAGPRRGRRISRAAS